MEFRIDDGNEVLRKFMKNDNVDEPYEKSYDSLMDVIEKIEHIVEVEKPYPLHKVKPSYYYIGLGMITLSLEDGTYKYFKPEGTRKERNWKCCVEFVIWLNSQKNNEETTTS